MSQFGVSNLSVLVLGAPIAGGLLFLYVRSLLTQNISRGRMGALVSCRMAAMLLILLLLAQPVWRESDIKHRKTKDVALLVDRSASMSLSHDDHHRYGQALAFVREVLAPSLAEEHLRLVPYLFAERAERATGEQLASAEPDGRETNLAGAIVQSLAQVDTPPRAILALSDGAATVTRDNNRAMSLLMDQRVPLIGLAVGEDSDAQLLSLDQLSVPRRVGTDNEFTISGTLRATGQTEIPTFTLLLTRNGKLINQRKVEAGKGPRIWRESFVDTSSDEGVLSYRLQIQLEPTAQVTVARREAGGMVRVTKDDSLRVLFVQGALTWDYKFIRLALQGDPSVIFSGLSRAASGSQFYQSVEEGGDLIDGFPTTIEQLSRFHLVILSHIGPADLTPNQQKMIDTFCGQFGGGVLLIGGPSTFTSAWTHSSLEKLLPVRFPNNQANENGQLLFRVTPTQQGLRHPVFQLAEKGNQVDAWAKLPSYRQFARVHSIKPAAEVWLQTSQPHLARTPEPLMLVQRYGAGTSAVICVQNFWRWRLAESAIPTQFDRFWRQLARYLAHGELDSVTVTLGSDDLRTGKDIELVLERRPEPGRRAAASASYNLQITDSQGQTKSRTQVKLPASGSIRATFRSDEPGTFLAQVLDDTGVVCASRSFALYDLSAEFIRTARNLDVLRQWAGISGGVVIKTEECTDATELVKLVKDAIETPDQQPRTVPAGVNGWVLAFLLTCMGAEWALRRRWALK